MARYEGPIAGLPADKQANTILYRLAEALGYKGHNGVIIAEPDEILEEALETIWRYEDLKY